MMEYDFLRSAAESIRTYKEFPLPAVITDLEFCVRWSNRSAHRLYSHFCETQGIREALQEFDPADILEEIRRRGSCTIEEFVPLSAERACFLPLMPRGELIGTVAVFLGEAAAGARTGSRWGNTAHILSDSLQRAVGDMFLAMDTASIKADIMNAGWLKHGFERVGEHCYRILRVAGNISLYSAHQRGVLLLQRQTVDLFSQLRELGDIAAPMSRSMGIPVEFRISEDVALVQLDVERFRAVLLNLIHNALYFTRPGNRVRVSAMKVKGRLEIRVADRGLGIPPEILPQVFRPYYSYDHREGPPTVGLGLTLCKILTEAHGGGISLTSRPGRGTLVRVWLPENGFTGKVSLAQISDRFVLADRFSPVYTGLLDAVLSPYREDAN